MHLNCLENMFPFARHWTTSFTGNSLNLVSLMKYNFQGTSLRFSIELNKMCGRICTIILVYSSQNQSAFCTFINETNFTYCFDGCCTISAQLRYPVMSLIDSKEFIRKDFWLVLLHASLYRSQWAGWKNYHR